ncbi:MAG: hypothetical protein KHY72_10000 [Streptococcus agalactiae]|nr:hypothetical protein [Streptococcus agalactiae]
MLRGGVSGLIKGAFYYKGRNIRYVFKILEYCNTPGIGFVKLSYKIKKVQLFARTLYTREKYGYENLLKEFNELTDEELREYIEKTITKAIELDEIKKRMG